MKKRTIEHIKITKTLWCVDYYITQTSQEADFYMWTVDCISDINFCENASNNVHPATSK
ncbi:9527_t:CDS:2 [Paraglomus brasilianum]|uniref:9527_t:CDS:1 n=1 Tax=Paraglomus brasilianum TaxID=144538 RepID=A0A9N8WKP1_9GLOM|nr:9527_t:CDS:2 [Paraglomus brasilianum]